MSDSGNSGFIDSPAGWIPMDWKSTTLGEVIAFRGGNAFKEKFQGKGIGDFPFIKVSDFNLPGNDKFIQRANHWIDAEDNKVLKATLFDAGAIVFAKVGAALLSNRRRILTRKTATDNNLMAATPKGIDGIFCYYHLQTVDFGKLVQEGAVPSINQSQLQGLPLALPPLAEQQRIAAILTTVDAKLDLIARQIATTQSLKQGLMQSVLRDGRPKWSVVPLHQVAEIRTGVAKGKKGLKSPATLPYLRVANVQDGHIDLTEVKSICIESTQIERYSLRAGDVLMTEGGDFDKLGRGDVWEGQISPCLHQNHVFAVRPVVGILNPYYLAALAASDYGRQYFLACSKRTTNLASINSTQLKVFPVLLPPIQEQHRIAGIVDGVNSKIRVLESKRAHYQCLKRGLMQKLLTGTWRVKLDLVSAEGAQPDENVSFVAASSTAMEVLMGEVA